MRFGSKVLAGGLCALGLASTANAELIYGLTNLQQLVRFDSETRTTISSVGLAGFSVSGDFLLSIDVRPATGQLYGLSNSGRIFVINPADGTSAQVGAPLNPAPAGTLRAIDFNPMVDRIRLITSSDTNLRINPDTGVIAATDTNLAFAAGDTNVGDDAQVVNGAYTNSFPGATSTTLYDLDAFNDVLTVQAPPNDGLLTTRGSLGFALASSGGFTGFDISGTSGTAYLVGNALGVTGALAPNSLYRVNLDTGAATLAGAVTGTGLGGSFRDIAVVPEPTSLALVGLAGVMTLRRKR